MNLRFSHWLFEEQNWRWILLIVMAGFIIPVAIYQYLTSDIDLGDRSRRDEIANTLESELKGLALPEKTAINRFENSSKEYSILITSRYRTELTAEEFGNALNSELAKKGWIYYATEKERGFLNYNYCRGKLNAELSHESGQGIWADGGDYWRISFSLGFRIPNLLGAQTLPPSCRVN